MCVRPELYLPNHASDTHKANAHFAITQKHFVYASGLQLVKTVFLRLDKFCATVKSDETCVLSEMGVYRDNLSATICYRLSLSLKTVLIYRLPISLL